MRLLFLGPKSCPDKLIRDRAFIIFGKKIHPVLILNTVCLSNLGFFLLFFLLFHLYLANFSLFYVNFIHFPHLVPLVNFGYTGKNCTVRLLKLGDLPPCAFITDRAFIRDCRVICFHFHWNYMKFQLHEVS